MISLMKKYSWRHSEIKMQIGSSTCSKCTEVKGYQQEPIRREAMTVIHRVPAVR